MTALKSILRARPAPKKAAAAAVDLDKLEAALNETSRRAAAQWLGFLSLWAYLFFTTVAVTDYDLLVETPVKLPLIGVELGLFSFFVWTPALFLVVHLYIARKVALLARQAAFYRKQILTQKVAGAHLAARENRLDAFAVTGLLLRFDGGADQPPDRLLTGFTALTVYVTLFVLPLALYLAFLVYFLAYQHELTTWWHRVALLAGAGLAVYGTFRAGALALRRWVAGLSVGLLVLVVAPVFLVFTFSGEWLHEYSFAQHVFNVAGVYPDRLRPRQPAHLFAEAKKAGKLDEANQLDLAGRDFSGRKLRNAHLSGANLRQARFWHADMQGADLRSAFLQGTNLSWARLQGADLSWARMQSAVLRSARMQGANLGGAGLQGANLPNARMQGADLSGAGLQGAELLNADLQGAFMRGASLQGANLSEAVFRQTDMYRSNLTAISAADVKVELQKPSKEQVDQWLDDVPTGPRRDMATAWLYRLADSDDPWFDPVTIQRLKAVTEGVTPYARAAVISAALCQEEDGHLALRGVISYRFSNYRLFTDVYPATLLEHIQDVELCPAARGLTDDDRRQLAKAVAAEHRDWLRAEADEWFVRAGLGWGSAL